MLNLVETKEQQAERDAHRDGNKRKEKQKEERLNINHEYIVKE
jgi:hypothetical protein